MTTAGPRPPRGATQARAFHDGVAFAERFFMGESEVQKALQKVCAALDADVWAASRRADDD